MIAIRLAVSLEPASSILSDLPMIPTIARLAIHRSGSGYQLRTG